MKYRLAQQSDVQSIKDICDKQHWTLPSGIIFIAEDDNKNIVGILAIKTTTELTHFYAESALIAHALAQRAEGALEVSGVKNIQITVKADRQDLIDLYEKWGYVTEKNNIIIMEKEL
jgi:hypothetical protein